MIFYIIFAILLSILILFSLKKFANSSKRIFKKFFNIILAIFFISLFIFILRFNPNFIYGIPAFVIFLFRWRNVLFFLKSLLENKNENSKVYSNKMTRAQALEILGLNEDATRNQILSQYYSLSKKNHPDHGGSVWIASRLNKAKETLLG